MNWKYAIFFLLVSANLFAQTDDLRISSLIQQLKTAESLSFVSPQDLDREDIQEAIVTSNPLLMTKLPDTVKLHIKPIRKLAKKYYRFDFFIPPALRSQESVKSAFQAYSKIYMDRYADYLVEAIRTLHETEHLGLIHPDFFQDPTFMYVFGMNCPSSHFSNVRVSPMNIPSHVPAMPLNTGAPVLHSNRFQKLFYYFELKHVFKYNQMQMFLKKHPPMVMPPHCYPSDFLTNEQFVVEINQRFPNSIFIDIATRKNNSPEIRKIYLNKLITKLNSKYEFQRTLEQLKSEDLNSDEVQKWLFENPKHILILTEPVQFHRELLENFAKANYKPERFFSPAQKQDPVVSEILSKYLNDSVEFMEAEKKIILKNIEAARCCGTLYATDLVTIVNNMPTELYQDANFHIQILEKISVQPYYLDALGNLTTLPKELKEYVVRNCKRVYGKHRLEKDRVPDYIKRDKKFHQILLSACK